MRDFNYANRWTDLLTPDIVALLTQIHECKGSQALFIEAKKDILHELLELARIQSTEASNKIEGIFTSEERLRKIVMDKTMPKTRSAQEIAGYRDVLQTIREKYEYITPTPYIILQRTRDLYRCIGQWIGGH